MIRWLKKKSGGATLEYMALVVFLLAAFFVFQKYILNAFWGQWKKAGDVFSHGKQYDPRGFGVDGSDGGTKECMFVYDDKDDPGNMNGVWVLQPCYDTCILEDGNLPATCKTNCQDISEFCTKEF